MDDYKTPMSITKLVEIDPKRVIVLDTETTGLKPPPEGTDEILSLTIVDLNGTVLFDELVRPERRKRWPKAQQINGITWAMVKDKPTLKSYEDQLRKIWISAELVVGYNIPFDLMFLQSSEVSIGYGLPIFDVMREFAYIHGEWSDYFQDVKWVKLSECAKYYHIRNAKAHSSFGDTETTRKCYLALLHEKDTRQKAYMDYEREHADEIAARKDREKKEEAERIQKENDGCYMLSAFGCAILIILIVILFSMISSCVGMFHK